MIKPILISVKPYTQAKGRLISKKTLLQKTRILGTVSHPVDGFHSVTLDFLNQEKSAAGKKFMLLGCQSRIVFSEKIKSNIKEFHFIQLSNGIEVDLKMGVISTAKALEALDEYRGSDRQNNLVGDNSNRSYDRSLALVPGGWKFPHVRPGESMVVGEWKKMISGSLVIGYVAPHMFAINSVYIARGGCLEAKTAVTLPVILNLLFEDKQLLDYFFSGATDKAKQFTVRKQAERIVKCFKSEAKGKERALAQEVERAQDNLTKIQRRLDGVKGIFSGSFTDKMVASLEELKRNKIFKEVGYEEIRDNIILYARDKIYLKAGDVEVYLGDMLISVEFSTCHFAQGQRQVLIYIKNLDNAQGGYPHPHSSAVNSTCFGKTRVDTFFLEGQFYEGFLFIRQHLETWNPNDEYGQRVELWDPERLLKKARKKLDDEESLSTLHRDDEGNLRLGKKVDSEIELID